MPFKWNYCELQYKYQRFSIFIERMEKGWRISPGKWRVWGNLRLKIPRLCGIAPEEWWLFHWRMADCFGGMACSDAGARATFDDFRLTFGNIDWFRLIFDWFLTDFWLILSNRAGARWWCRNRSLFHPWVKQLNFCNKNERFCIKNEELCIQMMNFAFKMMNFAAHAPTYGAKPTFPLF